MAILAKDKGGGDFKLVPADLHRAVCDMVVDLGIQPSDLYGSKHQIYIRWQLPDEQIEYTDEDGESKRGPMVIGKFYTLSLHEKSKLRPDLENWRGREFTEAELAGFDVAKVLGVPCMIQVQHKKKNNGDTRAVVSSITKVPKGTQPAKLEGDGLVYDHENVHTFDDLPEWLRKKVEQQVISDDDKPFDPSEHEDEDGVPTGF